MRRSVITNEPITGSFFEYYRESFWHMDPNRLMASQPRIFRELRIATEQYCWYRQQVQSLTTFDALQTWLNDEQFGVYSAPYNVMDARRYPDRYRRATVDKVTTEKINHIFRHDEYEEETIHGVGWEVELKFEIKVGRFDSIALKLGLAALGIYTYSGEYTTIKGRPTYSIFCYMLERDWKMTDAKDSRWYTPTWTPLNEIEDEEDHEEEVINEARAKAEMRAKDFEDGLLDDEIEEITRGYR